MSIQLLFKYINELISMFIIETRFLVRSFYEISVNQGCGLLMPKM